MGDDARDALRPQERDRARARATTSCPARPISALADDAMGRARLPVGSRAAPRRRSAASAAQPYADFLWWIRRLAERARLRAGRRHARAAAPTATRTRRRPSVLFEKLAQWGGDALVIPHGLAWGIHAPPGATLDDQLTRGAPRRRSGSACVEVFSGPRQRRGLRPRRRAADGAGASRGVCPAPTPDFLPCCWQAGEIVRARCGDLPPAECEARVAEARRLALEAGTQPQWVLPDASSEEWLDCDQCRGALQAGARAAPAQSAQAALASRTSTSATPTATRALPLRLRSRRATRTRARAGSGYKQVAPQGHDRRARPRVGAAPSAALQPLRRAARSAIPRARRAVAAARAAGFRDLLDVERGASFLYPGGLVGGARERPRPRRDLGRARCGARSTAPAARASCSGSTS